MKLDWSTYSTARIEFNQLLKELSPEKAKLIEMMLEHEREIYHELLDIITFVNQLFVRIMATSDLEELFEVLEESLSQNPKYHGKVFLVEGEKLISPYKRRKKDEGSLLDKVKEHARKHPINLNSKRVRLYKEVVRERKTIHCTVLDLIKEEMPVLLVKALLKLYSMNPDHGVIATPVIYDKKVIAVINITAPYLVEEFIPVVKNFSDALGNNLMHKRAKQALKESEAKFRELFETSKDMIYISNKERIIDINNAGVELLGFAKDEIFSMKVESFYAQQEDRRKLLDILETVGYVKDYEVDFRRKDNSIQHVLVTATKKEDNEGTWYEGIIRNITDQKKLEAQLLQAQKMEAVGTLAGGIAHDFNNIIGIIMGNVELIRMNREDGLPCCDNVNSIYTAAVRAKELTQQILAFSRQDRYNPSILDVKSVIMETTRLLSETFDRRIVIETRVDPDVDTIYADAVQVHQVILNLCTNSRDAMPYGGILTIKVANEVVDSEFVALHGGEGKGGDYLRFSVIDTGIGIDKTTQEHIFDPFFTTKEVGKGTGLGLSTVYGIAKRHGGFVAIHSKPGEGTTVSVYFPRSKKVRKIETPAQAGEVSGGNETVLIADDEPALRDLEKIRFESKGYRVLTAADGEQAIEMIQQHKDEIDLLIMDYNMPKKSGKEVLEEAYRINPGFRVMLVSGLGDTLPAKGVLGRVNKIVAKPYPTKELLFHARQILDSVKTAR